MGARVRERVRLRWQPEWEGAIKGWTKKFIGENKWRHDHTEDHDDLLQDAYLIFLKISDHYPRIIEPRHFMALYKTAIRNKTHDKARLLRTRRKVVQEVVDDALTDYALRIGEVTNAGYLNALLAEAPEELRLALALIESSPEKLREVTPIRENLNMKLRRLLGVDAHWDFSGLLKGILSDTR